MSKIHIDPFTYPFPYTVQEKATIRNWADRGVDTVINKLKQRCGTTRTAEGVRAQAKKLGVKIQPINYSFWTAKEEETLANNIDKDMSILLLLLPGREAHNICRHARKLGLSRHKKCGPKRRVQKKPKTKVCSECKRRRKAKYFHGNKTKTDLLHNVCKDCAKYIYAYQQTPRAKYKQYIYDAEQKKCPFKLTFEDFMLFWQLPCTHCGAEIDTIGLDRIHNDKYGYQIWRLKNGSIRTNVLPSCTSCNWSRGKRTIKEFYDHAERIFKHRHPNTDRFR